MLTYLRRKKQQDASTTPKPEWQEEEVGPSKQETMWTELPETEL